MYVDDMNREEALEWLRFGNLDTDDRDDLECHLAWLAVDR